MRLVVFVALLTGCSGSSLRNADLAEAPEPDEAGPPEVLPPATSDTPADDTPPDEDDAPAPTAPPEDEPPEENDPTVVPTSPPPPSAPPPPSMPPPPPPATSDPQQPTEACYLGPDRDDSVCLPTVDASLADYDYPWSSNAQYAEPMRYLDLDVIDPSTELAPNFLLSEIAQDWKGQYAVVQPHAVDRLQDLRDQLGALGVNSGYRPPDYNASVGGATLSRHMYGDAFDLDPYVVGLTTLQNACYDTDASYVQVYSTHIHCDWRNDSLSPVFYGASFAALSSSTFSFEPITLDAEIVRVGDQLTAPAIGWDEGEPLREWTAFDPDGHAIDTSVGDSYSPPDDAHSVEVWVGRDLLRTVLL